MRKWCKWPSATTVFVLPVCAVVRQVLVSATPVGSLVSIFVPTGRHAGKTSMKMKRDFVGAYKDFTALPFLKPRFNVVWLHRERTMHIWMFYCKLLGPFYLSFIRNAVALTASSYFMCLPSSGLSALSDWIRLDRAERSDWTLSELSLQAV